MADESSDSSYTTNPDGLGFGGIHNAIATANEGSPFYDAGGNSYISNPAYSSSGGVNYSLPATNMSLDVNQDSWSIPEYLKKFVVGKAGEYAGLGPMSPIAAAGIAGAADKGIEGAAQAAGQSTFNTVSNMILTGINPFLGLGTSLYGTLTGNTPYKMLSSWSNPTNAKAPMYDSSGKLSGSGNSGAWNKSGYASTGTGTSNSSSKVSWGWGDLLNLGASAAGENKMWSDVFDSYSTPSTGNGLKNPGYTLGDTSAPTQPGLQNVSLGQMQQSPDYLDGQKGLQVASDATYNPYSQVAQQYSTPNTSQFNLGNIGKSVTNNAGTLAQTLMGLYTQQRNRSALNRQISGLESLYNPNGAYSQQLRAKLNAQAAQQGKRSNTSAREVQLQAMLADKASSLAPSLYQMQTGVNSSYAATLDTLLGAYRKWE